jgi:CRP-like cAMP-binding protein
MINKILRRLPPKEQRVFSPQLKPIVLQKGTVLYEAGQKITQVYFPETAMVSYLSGTSEGETIEVCVVGNEGIVGVASLLANSTAFRVVVQISGRAYSLSQDLLRREFKRCDVLHSLLLDYTNGLLVQVAQTAVCNKFHSVEERFCRWLLMACDRIDSNDVPMTQDAMARVLGSRRASVTVVAGALQRKGVIGHKRGVVTLIDRRHLETVACECYETIRAAQSKEV